VNEGGRRAEPGIWSAEAGDPHAPLVALIHGSMDRSAGMLKLSRRLDDRFRVLRYDRRGYGRSAPHIGPYDIDAQVGDLVELLGGRRAVLFGHSYGGNVALATAARYPDLVGAVAIYETPLSWEPWWPGSSAGSRAVAEPGSPAVAAEKFIRRMLGDARWEALPERVRVHRLTEGAALLGELGDLQVNPPWQPSELQVPVALAFGSNGGAHHRRGMQQAAATIAGATLVEIAGCGHDAPFTAARDVCVALLEPLLARAGAPWTGSSPVDG
jgi:pimeloyl-ACP methyl ester carboxylesterase